MSRRNFPQNGLKLPRQLQRELGLDLNPLNATNRRAGGGGIGQRKDGRKADLAEIKARKVTGSSVGQTERRGKNALVLSDMSEEEEQPEDDLDQRALIGAIARKEPLRLPAPLPGPSGRKLKSILKPQRLPAESTSSTSGSDHERSPSPGLVLDSSSKSFRHRAAQDDVEITALERKLGLKAKMLPGKFDEDGLGDLLEGIDSGDDSGKRKRQERDWLARKRRRAKVERDSDEEKEDFEEEEDEENDRRAEGLLEEEDFSGFKSTAEDTLQPPALRKRENPYVAPVSDTMTATTKYIPPSLRKLTNFEDESLHQLRRQIQGQLNKLSEANLLSILAEVEKLYQTNARQDVTSTLIDFLLSLFCDASVLQNTFVILHASFVAAVYKVMGTDFGAELVSQLVQRFQSFNDPGEQHIGKQRVNLVSLLAHLYTFHVVGSNLVFDHIRILLETLNETNAELLLRIIRDTGPQLRQDDPSSLKDIVLLMQKSAAYAQAEGAMISVRTKFMIETITDLKNNKLKTDVASSGVASEHITRMRKVVGTLNSRNIRASEPLRIGLADVNNADKRGKWWLIGASWKEVEKEDKSFPTRNNDHSNDVDEVLDGEQADLVLLARQHRMNTAVRRAIFIAIMSANDYQDAHLRLLKLRLKRSQQQEIPRVLMHCAAAEERYNPYYTLIAKTLCADKKARMAFQFSLWDFFKRIGETADDFDDDGEDDGEEVHLKEIVNTAKMFGNLIADGTLPLGILKMLNLALLKEQASMFVEILLVTMISKGLEGAKEDRNEDLLAKIFARCKETPQMIGGLRHFLKKVVRHTDLAGSKSETRLVRWGCGVAINTLKMISSSEE